MKNKLWLTIGLISVLFLAACGDDNEESKEKSDSKQAVEEKVEAESTTSSDTTTPLTEEQKETETEETTKDSEQKSNVDKEDGKVVEEKGVTKTNDDLTINVLPNYSLDQEEPGKYVVIDNKTGDMLRIEKAPDEATEEITSQIKMRALAVSDEIFHNETAGTALEGSVHYKAYNGDDVVNIIYMPSSKAILTIFEKKKSENIEQFVAMAETIKWK